MKITINLIFFLVAMNANGQVLMPNQNKEYIVSEINTDIFTHDSIWRGADGAASIDLKNGKVLWLFSDTFIDTQAKKQRKHATMINNSIAILHGSSLDRTKMAYFYQGELSDPKSFFSIPGDTWFWTGHGTLIDGQLVVFLIEEKSTPEDPGFEAVGWYIALIQNPNDSPLEWDITYIKGTDTNQIIVGSSAVFIDENYLYAYGVAEPQTHHVYLARFQLNDIKQGKLNDMEWWNNKVWTSRSPIDDNTTPLFVGQTEFSVHFDPRLNQYIQIQTHGFGAASLGYRKAEKPQGPWSEPILFYQPKINHQNEFVYTANAHPEFTDQEGVLITYNINNSLFEKLLEDESIYFPKTVKLKVLQ